MRHPTHASLIATTTVGEEGGYTATPMEQAGRYLKELRQTHKLTQSALAEAVAVGRGMIERLESGDDRISVGTVLHVLKVLGASPCYYYYDLATQPTKTLGEIYAQRAIVRGIVTYVRVLAERKHVGLSALDDFAYSPLMFGADGTGDIDAISTYALLLALIYLEAPLADLAPSSMRRATTNRLVASSRSSGAPSPGSSTRFKYTNSPSDIVFLPSMQHCIACRRFCGIVRICQPCSSTSYPASRLISGATGHC